LIKRKIVIFLILAKAFNKSMDNVEQGGM